MPSALGAGFAGDEDVEAGAAERLRDRAVLTQLERAGDELDAREHVAQPLLEVAQAVLVGTPVGRVDDDAGDVHVAVAVAPLHERPLRHPAHLARAPDDAVEAEPVESRSPDPAPPPRPPPTRATPRRGGPDDVAADERQHRRHAATRWR